MKPEIIVGGRPELIGRRALIAMLGGAAAAWPRRPWAQDAPNLRVGAVILPALLSGWQPFKDRLRELGWVEGRNFTLDNIADAADRPDRYPAAFKELVARKANVLLAIANEGELKTALAATSSIPIVMIALDYDPLALGYVTSLARPTGNVTGVVSLQVEMTEKRLQFVRDLFPDARSATVFWNSYSVDLWRIVGNAGSRMGLELTGVEFKDAPYDYDRALADVPPDARKILFVLASGLFLQDRERLAKFALDHGAALFGTERQFPDAGALLSYGVSNAALFRRVAEYVDRLARGAKPSDLPIEQPTTFELVINQKTAKALGLAIPPTLLARADEVIE